MTASVAFSYSGHSRESQEALNEEVEFFRDVCGWPEGKIETHLGLAPQTLLQRRMRAAKKGRVVMAKTVTDEINEILAATLSPDGIEVWWGMKIPALAGHTPREMLEHGDTVALLDLARSYLNESFS